MAPLPNASAINLMALIAQNPFDIVKSHEKGRAIVPVLIGLEKNGFIYKKDGGWFLTDKGKGHVEHAYKREAEQLWRNYGRERG